MAVNLYHKIKFEPRNPSLKSKARTQKEEKVYPAYEMNKLKEDCDTSSAWHAPLLDEHRANWTDGTPW